MKKLAIIALLTAATGVASAAEVGVRMGQHGDDDARFNGVTVTETIKGVKTEFAFDRHSDNGFSVNRFSALGVMDLTKVGDVTISAKGGLAHLNPSRGESGFAAVVGLGASYPFNKTTTLVVDVNRMRGQSRVSSLDGTGLSVGVKFAF